MTELDAILIAIDYIRDYASARPTEKEKQALEILYAMARERLETDEDFAEKK